MPTSWLMPWQHAVKPCKRSNNFEVKNSLSLCFDEAHAYLSPQQCENAGAILQLLETKGISISLRTYYVHRDEAIEVLSSILWGYTSQDCEKITNLLTPD